jgi:hypothetical protein
MYYVGVDLHKHSISLCVVELADRERKIVEVLQVNRLDMNLQRISKDVEWFLLTHEFLERYLVPFLTNRERRVAKLEGWILGVM